MYCYVKCSFLVKVLVVVSVLQCSEVSGNDPDDAINQRNVLIDKFQNALLNDSKQLFILQKAFLLPREKCSETTGVFLNVNITAKGTIINCDYSRQCMYKRFELSPASLLTLADFLQLPTIMQALIVLDPFFYVLTGTLSIVNRDDDCYGSLNDYTIHLMIDKIDLYYDQEITDALYVTLSRARSYFMFKNKGILLQEMLEDISWIKDVTPSYNTNYWYYSSYAVAWLILLTYFLLNLMILIFTMLYLGKVFNWIKQSQHKHLKDLYKASAIVLAFINLFTFVSDLLILYSIYFYDLAAVANVDNNIILFLTAKLFLVVLIFILDTSISCFNTCKYSPEWKIMHALALCQFVWFVHRLATDTIISAIAFVTAPAQTFGTVTLLLSTVVCAVLFLSTLLKKCHAGCYCKSCYCKSDTPSAICCIFLIAICTIGLIITVTLLFIFLVDNGLQSAGIGGFILSLVPPTAVFVIGLCVSRENAIRVYHNVFASSSITDSAKEADTSTDEKVDIQTDKYTQLVQTSVAIDMEGHEEFEEEPYRPAQNIGL